MKRKRPFCTPARVGIMSEAGMSVREIAKEFKESESLVRRYLKEWNDATPNDRRRVRSWILPQKGK